MKDKITVLIFIIYIMFFSIAHIVIKDKDISETERRHLANMPQVKLESEFFNDLDEYLLDQFPFREGFRSVKAHFNFNILGKLDNNDIYLKDNYIFKTNYPTNKKSVNNFINKTIKIKEMLTKDNNVYMMIIPDKNYYLDSTNFLHIDYDYIYNEINKISVDNIDVRNILKLSDYYETDTHWKQERLDKIIKKLSSNMGFEYQEFEYKKNTFNKFYGVYYGESAVNRRPETLTYLTNDIIDNAEVKYLENDKLRKVYNTDNLKSLDAYEVYLDGASAFIEIYNKENKTNKELIIFRDSFGSSLTPLLIPYYSKITVIDNRYINSKNILKYIEFDNQDVLFLYSTLMLNNSFSLKG